MQLIFQTDLILNSDNSIYHLNRLLEDVAETIANVVNLDLVGK
jgi:hypothetical protein